MKPLAKMLFAGWFLVLGGMIAEVVALFAPLNLKDLGWIIAGLGLVVSLASIVIGIVRVSSARKGHTHA